MADAGLISGSQAAALTLLVLNAWQMEGHESVVYPHCQTS